MDSVGRAGFVHGVIARRLGVRGEGSVDGGLAGPDCCRVIRRFEDRASRRACSRSVLSGVGGDRPCSSRVDGGFDVLHAVLTDHVLEAALVSEFELADGRAAVQNAGPDRDWCVRHEARPRHRGHQGTGGLRVPDTRSFPGDT